MPPLHLTTLKSGNSQTAISCRTSQATRHLSTRLLSTLTMSLCLEVLVPCCVYSPHTDPSFSLPPSTHVGDNGSMHFWDWQTGYNFQKLQTQVQPGSLDSEAGIFTCCFDVSGCRLLTAEADKTIKIYKEEETAVRTTFLSRVILFHCCLLLPSHPSHTNRQRRHTPLTLNQRY